MPRVEDAEALIDGKVRAIVLVTPNNPTGAVYPAAGDREFRRSSAASAAFISSSTRLTATFCRHGMNRAARAVRGDDMARHGDPALFLLEVLRDPGPPHRCDHGRSAAHRAGGQDSRLHPDLRAAHGAGRACPGRSTPCATGARRTAPRSTAVREVFPARARAAAGVADRLGRRLFRLSARIPSRAAARSRSPRSWRRNAACCACPGSYFGPGAGGASAGGLRQCRRRRAESA